MNVNIVYRFIKKKSSNQNRELETYSFVLLEAADVTQLFFNRTHSKLVTDMQNSSNFFQKVS